MDETQRRLRGHAFAPPKAILNRIPPLNATDGTPAADKVIHAHYLSAGTDSYLTELEQREEDGHWIAYGYAVHAGHPEGAEWEYSELTEMEASRGRSGQGLPLLTERDMGWQPKPFREAIPAANPERPEPVKAGAETPGAGMGEKVTLTYWPRSHPHRAHEVSLEGVPAGERTGPGYAEPATDEELADDGHPQEWSSAAPDPDDPGPGGDVSVREAQRYVSYLPPGVRLSEATRGQLAEAIRQGRAATPAVDPCHTGRSRAAPVAAGRRRRPRAGGERAR
jgi:hypothetical protein